MSVVSSADLDRRILETLEETRRRGHRCAIGWIAQALAVSMSDIDDALESLENRKLVQVRAPSGVPHARRFSRVDTDVSLTTKGRDALRRLKASVQFNVRLPGPLARDLREYADSTRASASEVAVRFIEEGIRMTRFPGIDFRVTPTGRVAHATGTGLSVWEVLQIWLDREKDARRVVSDYPSLTGAQVNTAIAYAQSYAREAPPRAPRPPFARDVAV